MSCLCVLDYMFPAYEGATSVLNSMRYCINIVSLETTVLHS
jgi:hypothetical protein